MKIGRFGKKTEKPDKAAEKQAVKAKEKEEKAEKRHTISLDALMNRKTTELEMPEPSFSTGPAAGVSDDGFVAGVRSADPVLSVDDSSAGNLWKKDIAPNAAGAVLVFAFLSLFCMVTDSYELIPFVIPGAMVFAGITTAESLKPGRLKWMICGGAAALLVVLAVIFRGAVFGGLAGIINDFYDVAEAAQAYVYKRPAAGEDGSASVAAVWISCVIGLIAALPPARARRTTMFAIAFIAMLAFAYYGLLPSWIFIAVMLAALLIGVSRGNVLAVLPVMLSVMLIFGVIVLIDPGEFYGISRMDENFRDRFALNSLLIQNDMTTPDDLSGLDDSGSSMDSSDDMNDEDSGRVALYTGIGIAVLIIAAIGAAVYLLWRRLDSRRKALREGIDSSDPREAVTAMFPYSVRWLRAGGVEVGSDPFFRLTGPVAAQYNQDYADRYSRMYLLWREAAYSDHVINETDRNDMDQFLKDTVDMVKEKLTFSEKVTTLVKYAL